MIRVKGRVLEPPMLKLKSRCQDFAFSVYDTKCQWNFVRKSVVEGVSLKHWAVLDFSGNGSDRLDNFITKLVARCKNLGMEMAPPMLSQTARMRDLSSVASLTPVLNRVHKEALQKCEGNKLQLLLCVMSKKDAGYKYTEWVSEMKVGVLTQCCLTKI